MAEHMAGIVFSEHRPFSYGDFARFSVRDKVYTMTHGTYRNKISKSSAKGEVELNYRSTCAFYSLKGHKFGKRMTHDHTVVPFRKSNFIYELINNLPLGKNSLHDIRLTFKVNDIWSVVSNNSEFRINFRSKDIHLPGINVDELFIGVTVHRTDTISVIVSCSYAPVAVDFPGVIRLSNALTRVEERLSKITEDSGLVACINHGTLAIPNHMEWIVKMWHFGADALIEYSGEKFEITYADAEGTLTRIYSKQMKDGRIRLRPELQEYPNKQLDKAIEEKLNANNSDPSPSGHGVVDMESY